MWVLELLHAEALSLLGHATLANTAAASKATTATFSHSNLDTFYSVVNNYTEATGVNWTHPAQPGTYGQTTCQTQKAHSSFTTRFECSLLLLQTSQSQL